MAGQGIKPDEETATSKEERDLRVLHEILQGAYDNLVRASPCACSGSCSSDTTFSIGETLGFIAKAKALVGRDLDDLLARPPG